MAYRTPLETRIAKKTTKAIADYNLIEDGDRVMVGLSGGKDSWALFQILDVLRQRAPIRFSMVAVNVDSGYEGYQHQAGRGRPARSAAGNFTSEHHHDRRRVIDDNSRADDTPCSLCPGCGVACCTGWLSQTGATKSRSVTISMTLVETVLLEHCFSPAR